MTSLIAFYGKKEEEKSELRRILSMCMHTGRLSGEEGPQPTEQISS